MMTSRIKSTIGRHTESFKASKITAIASPVFTRFSNKHIDTAVRTDGHVDKDFYEGKNYKVIIECLDGGYQITQDLWEYWQEYVQVLEKHINNLQDLSQRSQSKLKSRPLKLSYHTTKRAQKMVLQAFSDETEYYRARCKAIKDVLDTYQQDINIMYPGSDHQHYQTKSFVKMFEGARSQLVTLSDDIEKLESKRRKTANDLKNAMIECENLGLTYGVSESKVKKANNNREHYQKKLENIEAQVSRLEQQYDQEKDNYRNEARRIYKKCRQAEQERLELIGKTLLKFVEAAYGMEDQSSQSVIYDKLVKHLMNERDVIADLDFWAKNFGISDDDTIHTTDEALEEAVSSRDKTRSKKIETQTSVTTSITSQQSVPEDEQASSTTDTTVVSKSKRRQK